MRNWYILAAYSTVVAATQMLWLSFSPVTTQVAAILHTTVESITLLSLIFPLVYVVLAPFISVLLDRHFVPAVAAGAVITGVGGLLRLVLPYSFPFQFGVQVLISVGQPFILGSLSIVAVYYFEERERPTAISIGSLSIFIGIIAATAGGLYLFYSTGYFSMLMIEAVPGIAGMIALPLFLKGVRPIGLLETYQGKARFHLSGLHIKLAVMLFIGMGIFDALDTWLQPMLANYGLGGTAGNLIALMTLMGIFGAAILPKPVSDRRKRRLAISVIIAFSFLSLLIIGFIDNFPAIALSLALEGFFLLAGLPILIEWGEQATPPQFQGRVTSLLMIFGNLGGIVLIALGDVTFGLGNRVTSLMLVAFVVVLIPVLISIPNNVGFRETEQIPTGE